MIPLHDDNPTSIRPAVTVMLIIASVMVFLWELSLGDELERAFYAFGTVPSVLFATARLPADVEAIPPALTVITSMFLHGGWMHLIGNMLYLWIFGNNIEDAMGHARFIVFYLLCGIAATMAHALMEPQSALPMVGASGAISGVLGAYLLLYPHARVFVAVPFGLYLHTTYLPALVVLGFWFVLQLVNSLLAPPGQGGVAWYAHIGGFVAGMALIPFLKYRRIRFFNPPHHAGRWRR